MTERRAPGGRDAAGDGPDGSGEARGREAGGGTGGRSAADRSPLAVDVLLAGYLAVTGVLALTSFRADGLALAAVHALAVWMLLGPVAGLGRPVAGIDAPAGGTPPDRFRRHVLRFVRVAYPVLLTPLLYMELDVLNQLHVQGYLDPAVQRWEDVLFGAQLSVTWARGQPWRWLSELMHLGYFSYYVLIPVSGVLVYRRGGARELQRFTMATGLAFLSCYAVFVVFPVAGPRYLFEPLQGVPARALFYDAVHAIAEQGSSKGTAFPSSHVAGTIAAWLASRRVARGWFWISAPLVALLTLGTVYGRFHYAVDSLAGLAVALAAYAAGPALGRWLSARSPGLDT